MSDTIETLNFPFTSVQLSSAVNRIPNNYGLLNAPNGATIDTNGVITWTPAEAQGPSTNIFTTIVTDNGSPSLSATNAFTVVVTEVNTAPLLPAQTNRSVVEATPLVVTNTLLPFEYPLKTTHALLGSAGSMQINSGAAEPTGTVPVTAFQVVPPSVVL